MKMNSPKATRVHLSIAKKIEVLDFVKKTKFKKEVCLRYNLAPSTLSTLMKNKKLRDEFYKNNSTLKRPRHVDLEAFLVKWVTLVRDFSLVV